MSDRGATPAEVAACLERAERVLITSHTSPDGDAVGSELAAAELIGRLGGAAHILNRDPAPDNLAFLPGAEKILVQPSLPVDLENLYDLALVLECPNLDRTGFSDLSRLPILNIDHHLDNERFGRLNFVDEQAAAVGEMLLEVVEAGGAGLTATMATCLYTALVTDTGDFRYSNTSPRTLSAAGRLVAGGAEPAAIADALWFQVPERVVRLTAEVLATLRLYADGSIAVIHCDEAMLARCGASPADTDDLINHVRAIAGVEAAVFLKAFTPDVRISLRSRGRVDVRAAAAGFGGGGHRNAAGCTISDAGVAAAEARVVKTLRSQLKRRNEPTQGRQDLYLPESP